MVNKSLNQSLNQALTYIVDYWRLLVFSRLSLSSERGILAGIRADFGDNSGAKVWRKRRLRVHPVSRGKVLVCRSAWPGNWRNPETQGESSDWLFKYVATLTFCDSVYFHNNATADRCRNMLHIFFAEPKDCGPQCRMFCPYEFTREDDGCSSTCECEPSPCDVSSTQPNKRKNFEAKRTWKTFAIPKTPQILVKNSGKHTFHRNFLPIKFFFDKMEFFNSK